MVTAECVKMCKSSRHENTPTHCIPVARFDEKKKKSCHSQVQVYGKQAMFVLCTSYFFILAFGNHQESIFTS